MELPTNEEMLLKDYKLLLAVVKAHGELILPDETLNLKLENNSGNQSLIDRLTNSFMLRKRQTTDLQISFGLNTMCYKRFLTSYAKTLVKDINNRLMAFQLVNSFES